MAAASARASQTTSLYKWRWDIPTLQAAIECKVDTDGYPFHVKEDIRFDPADLEHTAGTYAYYYARDRSASNVMIPEREGSFAIRFTRGLLPTQKEFLDCYAPNNRVLLSLFFQSSVVNLKLIKPNSEGIRALKLYQGERSSEIQRWLRKHSSAAELTSLSDLQSRIKVPTESERALARQSTDYENTGNDPTLPVYFYHTVFLSLTERVAVPLPRGVVLFEGRTFGSVEERVLKTSIRREVFSTSWHPNAALTFVSPRGFKNLAFDSLVEAVQSRNRVLFVHKIVSDGILACDAQGDITHNNINPDCFDSQYSEYLEECEITVQPFVKLHVVDESIHLMQYNRYMTTREKSNPVSSSFVRTIFTHLYLGDKCPCGHEEDNQQKIN